MLYEKRLENEQAVIGSILIDPRRFDEIAVRIERDDFRDDLCKQIFEAAQALSIRGEKIDPLTVLRELLALPDPPADEETLKEYFMQLMEVTPTAANAEVYAELVREDSRPYKAGRLLDTSG